MEIKINLHGGMMPSKKHDEDAGYDLHVPEDTWVESRDVNFGRQVIPMGFSIELPRGYAASIRPRSGYSSKGMEGYDGFTMNGGDKVFFSDITVGGEHVWDCDVAKRRDVDVILGLCDSNYRGIYGVIIKNHGEGFWLRKGTRIAQMVIEKAEVDCTFVECELSETSRGDKGYGSSDRAN